jgi:hypothetical protein
VFPRWGMTLHPHLIVDVTLYPTAEGGHDHSIGGDRYGCPCKLHPDDFEGRDGFLILNGLKVWPGETRRMGIAFLSGEESASIFRAAGKFYLWEGRIIGEAVVVPVGNSN